MARLMNEDTSVVATDRTRGPRRLIPAERASAAHRRLVRTPSHRDGVGHRLCTEAYPTFEHLLALSGGGLVGAIIAEEALRLTWREARAAARWMRMHPPRTRVTLCEHMDCVRAAVAQSQLASLGARIAHVAAGRFVVVGVISSVIAGIGGIGGIIIRVRNCLPDGKGWQRLVPAGRHVEKRSALASA